MFGGVPKVHSPHAANELCVPATLMEISPKLYLVIILLNLIIFSHSLIFAFKLFL